MLLLETWRLRLLLFLIPLVHLVQSKPQAQPENHKQEEEVEVVLGGAVEIKCAATSINVKIPNPTHHFNGMVYPQGLSKNSTCLKEYDSSASFIEYSLPLRSCNTMLSLEDEDGAEEYFNTIVLEPHPKLVTGNGRGYHVRCKYRRSPKANTPPVTMKIFKGGKEIRQGGQGGLHNETEIEIGDPLQFHIQLHSNASVSFLVSDCHVRDGLGWAEELLVNHVGCPVDSDLLPPFTYSRNMAVVEFPAHKFPYSSTVYYSCAVRICPKGLEEPCTPPICRGAKNMRLEGTQTLKFKRDAAAGIGEEPATVQVYNGLFVNEPVDSTEADRAAEVLREKKEKGEVLCFRQRDFALAIAICGLILMVAVILLLFILCLRRRRSGPKGGSDIGSSSIYSGSGTNFTGGRGGYANTAYSHTSD